MFQALNKKTAIAALVQTTIAISITACGGGDAVVIIPDASTFTKSYVFVIGTQSAQLDLGTLIPNATISNIVGLPTGVTWDSKTNIITVSAATNGNVKGNPYTIKGTATKTDGSKVDITLIADIDNTPTLNTVFSAVSTLEDAPVTIDVLSHFGDINGDPLQLSDAKSDQGTVLIAGKNITFTRKAGFLGDATIEVTVADGRGGVVTKSFVVTVKAAAIDSPVTVDFSVENVTASALYAHCNITDLDGATGTCTLSNGQSWPIGDNRIISGLADNTLYTLTLKGTNMVVDKYGNKTIAPIDRSVDFRTSTIVLPPTCPPGQVVINGHCVVD